MQTATPQHPLPRGKKQRKLIILLAAIALVIIAALVTALLFTNTSNQQPYPIRDTMVPGAVLPNLQTPQAMRCDLFTAETARIYFDYLMDCDFIGLYSSVTENPLADGDTWTVSGETSDGLVLGAVFNTEGLVTSLSVTNTQGGALINAYPQYQLGNGDESLFTYIRAFAYEYLPDIAVVSGVITADAYNDAGPLYYRFGR